MTPALRDYPITALDLLLAAMLAVVGGLLTGALGLRLTRAAEPAETQAVINRVTVGHQPGWLAGVQRTRLPRSCGQDLTPPSTWHAWDSAEASRPGPATPTVVPKQLQATTGLNGAPCLAPSFRMRILTDQTVLWRCAELRAGIHRRVPEWTTLAAVSLPCTGGAQGDVARGGPDGGPPDGRPPESSCQGDLG